jgi:tRNA-splicing ligase RtcB (3'-phosphate/5'-hydroxy nucleic acid ligase)
VGDVPGGAVRYWVERPLTHDVEAAIRRLAHSDDVRHVAVMPDVHLAADVCVGMVVATANALYPNAVGGDIGCGVAAIAFDGEAALLDNERDAAAILAGLYRQVPLIRHSRKGGPRLPAALDAASLSSPHLDGRKQSEGSLQIGTLGRGNHFIELQADETGRLWLMVHSGSRGMGQAIRDHHLGQCSAGRNGLRFLSADSPAGRAYLQDLTWALDYAEVSRSAMVQAVRDVVEDVLGIVADEASYVSCNHNHVRRETHFGEALWVHRKGAMSAAEGECGLIPGSMGTHSFHVEGRGCEEALSSSAHGAGRRLSRTEARRSLSAKEVTRELRGVWFDHRLAPRLREEAPSAYKDIDDVLRAQHELVRIVRKLRPLLCFKGA